MRINLLAGNFSAMDFMGNRVMIGLSLPWQVDLDIIFKSFYKVDIASCSILYQVVFHVHKEVFGPALAIATLERMA